MTGLIVLVAVLAAASAYGAFWRARQGRVRAVDGDRLTAAEVGAPLGEQATLLQFSSAFCAPCRQTRVVLARVADGRAGIAHVEVDAESHLDLVRRLNVLKTPTTLVLDAAGRVVLRAAGVPRTEQVLAALSSVAPSSVAPSSVAPGTGAPVR